MPAAVKLVPIDPARDDEGRLLRLIPLVGRDQAFPYPRALPAVDQIAPFELIEFNRLSIRTAAKLGVTGILDAHGESFADSAIWDIRFGTLEHNPDGNAPITATFWGTAFRLLLRVRAFDARATTSFANLAAAVESRMAQVEYELNLVGSATPSMFAAALRGLPLFGPLTMEAYERLVENTSRIVDLLAQRLQETRDYRPIAIETGYRAPESAEEEAISARFAMLQIARGVVLDEAVKRAANRFDVGTIKETYRRVLGDDGVVSSTHMDQARDWLNA